MFAQTPPGFFKDVTVILESDKVGLTIRLLSLFVKFCVSWFQTSQLQNQRPQDLRKLLMLWAKKMFCKYETIKLYI